MNYTLIVFFFLPLLAYGQMVNDSLLDKQKSAIISNDTLVKSFLNSISDIISVENPIDQNLKDLDSTIRSLKKFKTNGTASIGYGYGLLTNYADQSSDRPLQVLNSKADLSINSFGLPLRFSYNYSTLKNPLGVNNYIRIVLDTEALKEQADKAKESVISELDERISSVQDGKDELVGKLGYGEVLKDKLSTELETYERQLESQSTELNQYKKRIDDVSSIDTINVSENDINTFQDSVETNKLDSIQNAYNNTYEKYQKTKGLYDTVSNVYNTALNLYNSYSNWQEQLDQQKNSLDGYNKVMSKKGVQDAVVDSVENRKSGLIGSLSKLELGLTYPETTALSNNNTPVKGIHMEFQKEMWFSSITAGTMMNNLMVSADLVQNKLFNSQNLFNQFDYQNIRQKGFLVNVKSGYGTKERNHAFLGVSYLTKSRFLVSDNSMIDSVFVPSAAVELDFKWAPRFLPQTSFDLVYGKTSDSKKIFNNQRNDPFASIFSSDRTNTTLFRFNQSARKIKSKMMASVRLIDPYADTRSFGVLQPNNIRYELRTTHQITRRLRVGLNYRQDRNNIDNALDTTIHLQVFGGQFDGRFGKQITFFGSVNYLTQDATSSNQRITRANNYMYGAGVSAIYKLNDLDNALTFNYNDYLLTDSVSTGLFRNIGLQNMTNFKHGHNIFTISYFKSNYNNQGEKVALIIGNEYSLRKKKFRLTCGIKAAFTDNQKFDMGGKAEFSWNITQNMEWSIMTEKLVLGDFYRMYDRARFDRFPYVITTNLNFTIN